MAEASAVAAEKENVLMSAVIYSVTFFPSHGDLSQVN
jgi:hypothetical protein